VSGGERALTVFYRALLRLHPAEQRHRYGAQMTEDFLRAWRRAHGVPARVTVLAGELAALAWTGVAERLRGAWAGGWHGAWKQLRPASPRAILRAVLRRPGHAATLVGTLALGLGAWMAALVVLDAMVLGSQGRAEQGALVEIWTYLDEEQNNRPDVAAAALPVLRQASDLFLAVEGASNRRVVITEPGLPEQVQITRVTPGFFDLLGVRPARGPGFAGPEPDPGGVVISHRLWIQRFGRAPDVLGRTLVLGEARHTVVGVMPPGFAVPGFDEVAGAGLWAPVPLVEAGATVNVLARLRAGVSVDAAAEALDARTPELRAAGAFAEGTRPDLNEPVLFGVPEWAVTTTWILVAAATLILLVAATSTWALVVTRSLDRHQEWAVRRSLGAPRLRVMAESAAEGLFLGAAAGAAGAVVAAGLLRLLVLHAPAGARLATVGRTLALQGAEAVGAVLLGAGIVGVAAAAAAWAGSRGQPRFPGAVRGSTEGRGTRRLRAGLVAIQVALSFLLLAGGGLLANSLGRLARVETGYDAEALLVATLQPPGGSYGTTAEREALYDRVEDRLRNDPAVAGVAATENALPLTSGAFRPTLLLDDGGTLEMDDFLPYLEVTPGFFQVAGVRILEGRAFYQGDPVPHPAVVGEQMARRLWPDGRVLGRRFRVREAEPFRTVVGVAHDVVNINLRDPAGEGMEFFVPLDPVGQRQRTFVVRARGPAAGVALPVRRIMQEVDPELPFARFHTLADSFGDSVARERFATSLVSVLAAMGLLVTTLGLYGLLAHQVGSRTREIGIRMSLGAHSGHLVRGIVGSGLAITGVGVALGVLAAVQFFGILEVLLYGVEPGDPATLAAAAALFLAVAVAACLPPAVRAASVDPAAAMRSE